MKPERLRTSQPASAGLSGLATKAVVGVIVVVVGLMVVQWVLGTILGVLKTALILALVVGALALVFRLKRR